MAEKVQVYIYDVTKGMARMMSPMLLGRQIDGVWHSAIHVFGNEYFFGDDGISYCPPSGTILGPPTQVVDLGETEIPMDMFNEFLIQLSEDRFSPDKYHLLEHNCNNFSNEVAQFLTGQPIPSYVVSLPEEVMSTPFGQQIRPMIEQMMGQMHGDRHVGSQQQQQQSRSQQQQQQQQPSTQQQQQPSKPAAAKPQPKAQMKDDDLD